MPRIGMEFDALEDSIQFYRIYAIACGLDIRRSSQKRFRDQTIRTKLLLCHREGFGESKKMKNMDRVTTIRRFGCRAMIKLVFNSGKYKLSRNPTLYHKQTIINNSKVNIGASKTFRICKEVANGYENVGASLLDFKNFQRQVKLFIGDGNAQIFINNHDKLCRNLCRVFWTDAHGKSAYSAFGDGVSFDPTYRTNRYCMVADKIDIITRKETEILSRLNGFDDKWNELIIEFGLEGNRWLSTMFDMKEYWIPAYFRDLHMGNIMSTTQRSESENSFFKKFENHYGTLIEFWLRYESTMDQQRHTHKRLEMETNKSIPKTVTPLSLESHALTVYTHESFYEIQEEIKSSMCGCGVVGYSRSAYVELSNIEDSEKRKIFSVQYNAMTSDVLCTSDESQLKMSKVWSEFYNVISVVAKKEPDVLRNLQRVLKEFTEMIEPTNEIISKQQEMEMLIGCSAPNEVRILPLRQSKNKGSGKRMVISKTKAIEKAKKPKRRCGNCKRMSYHDSRNCQEPFAKHPPEEEGSSDDEPVD
ncbi:hypothetical protein RND81_04G069500 [Saponaria officinalis]|uniref:FAR1 domain-containing protein n=1 Tax=Saponaria officinalis TaxID=3572 RepID=A0AAW1LD12_SAPOF